MVSIIENRSVISGKILSVSKEADVRGFVDIIVELASAADFQGSPNLARADEGSEILIRIQKSLSDVSALKCGEKVTLTVRKGSGKVYFLQE